MRTFVLGDSHGGYRALLQVFERCGFDYEKDRLISLGDVCDGWPEVRQLIDELLKVKNLILILGNHDEWSLEWMVSGREKSIWTEQGGRNTIKSYDNDHTTVPASHIELLKSAPLYYVDDKNRIFVHGGFYPNEQIEKQDGFTLLWDRDLIQTARRRHLSGVASKTKPSPLSTYAEIFVGHTTLSMFRETTPQNWCNLWALDTGGGWEGKLSIMDVDTKQFWQSDNLDTLYPGVKGRR